MQKLLLSLVVVVLCAPMLLARSDRKLQRQAARRCEYKWSECMFEGGATCGSGKKTGTSDNADCPVKQTEKKCRVKCPANSLLGASNCKYKVPRGADKVECDPVRKTKTITQTLLSGGEACNKTKTIQKPCRRSSREAGYQSDAAAGDSRCKYRKGQKGECNTQTNMRTITLNLKRKSPQSCPQTKTIEKPCKAKPARQEKTRKQAGGGAAGKPNRNQRRNQEN